MKYKYWLDNTGLSNGKKNLLLEYFQTAEEVYRGTEETYQKIPQLKEEEIQRITKAKRKWDINEEYQKLAEGGVSVTFACDKNYPKKLKNIYQPPFALYYSGKLPGERLSVAIVGARRCSEYGHYMARKLGEALGRNRIPVISGLAEGIDAAGQAGAIKGGGETYAVLGCGVDICYPVQNRSLYDAVLKNGEILSEYLPGTAPMACNFPPRNRIISGLSDALIVVEARQKSGTSITVNMALEQGKDVYAIPGRITDPMSLGCNHMISQGAGIITDIEEGLLEIRQMILERKVQTGYSVGSCTGNQNGIPQYADEMYKHADKNNKSQDGIGLHNTNGRKNLYAKDDLKDRLYACMDYMPKTMQQLYEEIGDVNIAEIMTALLQMELDGAVVEKGGAYSL